MPEDIRNNRLNIFFTQKELFESLFKKGNIELNCNIELSEIIYDWNKFNVNMPFVYCIKDSLCVGNFDEDKFNNSEFILIHDLYNGFPFTTRSFIFFSHSQTNVTIISALSIHERFMKNMNASHHEKEIGGVETPYYFLVKSIITHFKSTNPNDK
jgi:hypothetical protein